MRMSKLAVMSCFEHTLDIVISYCSSDVIKNVVILQHGTLP